MKTKYQTYPIILWFIIFLILVTVTLLAGGQLGPPIQAGNPLPPRHLPAGENDNDDKHDRPIGAYIELQVPNTPVGAWAIVQWEDNYSGWHNVEGWQGSLENGGRQRWWVAPKDFGTGPFRWQVKQGPDGLVLGTSVPFNLPGEAYQIVEVEVYVGN
jgi:hypothetical protein